MAVEVEDAQKWHDTSASLWSLVVAPFILVQEFERRLDS